MRKATTLVLQVEILILGLAAIALMIRMPLTEGRAENLDLFSIYTDPFIIYGYISSLSFFSGLYYMFRLLGYIRENGEFSPKSTQALHSLKYCAIALSILIMLAGIYIKIFHNKNDDPAGFLALCIVAIVASLAVAATAHLFEDIFQKAAALKAENEQLRK